MEAIRIHLRRHLSSFVLEWVGVSFILLLMLPDIMYSSPGRIFNMVCYGLFGLYVIYHIVKYMYLRGWDYPVLLLIKEDRIEIECMFLFIRHKKFCWQKEDVKIVYRVIPIVIKLSSIAISCKSDRGQILFESIAVRKEQMSLILNELRAKGYNIDAREGR